MAVPYTEEEVRIATFQINPSKAPGRDGFSALFFQKFWDKVKAQILREVLHFLNGGDIDKEYTITQIILIPKIKNPTKVTDFRPISLCSVISKITSRVILNRIQPFLDHIISLNQSAFVKNRNIADNIIIAQELDSFIRSRNHQKHGFASLKLDMCKAFDRIEWPFLEQILLKLGFYSMWIRNVMSIVKSVRYEVKYNNQVTDIFTPERGLREGDPLSPYLFILYSDWLSLRIAKSHPEKKISGIKISRDAPPVTHLFFADDSLLFLKASQRSMLEIKDILTAYERISGQKINYQKSEIRFSRNCSAQDRLCFSSLLGMKIVECHGKYLGISFICGHNKTASFNSLMDKYKSTAASWCNKALSVTEKEILIKFVFQAYPTYLMSCFLLPDKVTKQIQSIILRFWWGSYVTTKQTHWIKKDILYKSKIEGGLGLRNFRTFNLVMLTKQAWRILDKQDSLVSNVLKQKYFPSCDLLSAPEP